MRRIRFGLTGLGALLAAVGVALIVVPSAGATVTDGCRATLNGTDLTNLPDSSQITVGQDEIVPMTMTAPAGKEFNRLRISLSFALFQWDVYDESAGGGTWSKNIDVHSFAKYGVGLYRVHGSGEFSDGSGTCVGTVTVNVTGDPLTTVAGIVGAAAAGVGALGVVGAGIAAGGGGGGSGPGGSFTPEDAAKEEKNQREEQRTDDDILDIADEASGGWCFLFGVLVLTLALLVFGTGALLMGVVAAPMHVAVRRRTWPFIIGPISGVLAGLGVGVLLQEYAIICPTRTWAIVYLAGGFLFGLAVPFLRRRLSR